MKYVRCSWSLLFCLVSFTAFNQSYVGDGWAKTSVNAVVFRKNAVVSHKNTQYVSFYDSAGYVVVARRELENDQWTLERTPYRGNVLDAHNSISIMVDGEGYLHLAWDHHNRPLNYCRSVEPGSLKLTKRMNMIGQDEDDVTYPEFHRLPGGDLIFLYRSGASGRGNLIMNRYDTKHKKWSRVQDVLIDGEGERNAYWQFCTDRKGALHLSWVWRETPDVATNHDLCYARSDDGGKTWRRSTGEQYQLPINVSNAEYAMHIPQSSELINQTSMSADENGNPYIATYWRDTGSSVPQYFVVFNGGNGWERKQLGSRTLGFSLNGGGTKKIPIARPQIVVRTVEGNTEALIVLRDSERGSKVTVAINGDVKGAGEWQYKDVTDYSVGAWEPSFDTELWKENKQLHLFVQRCGQGDGEKTENIEAQPVYIIPVPFPR